MKRFLVWLLILFAIIPLQSFSPQLPGRAPQRELDALTKRGYTYRLLDNDLIELTDPVSGTKHLKSLREPSEATIRSWAVQRGIPILEIDPNTIDTSQYTGWFRYWSRVPISNTNLEPVVVGDANRNGKAEVYGLWWDYGANEASWVVEVDTNGGVSFLHDFSPRMGIAQSLIDSDNDSLYEFAMTYWDKLLDFEQQTRTSLPVTFNFEHQRYQSSLSPGYTGMYFGNLDGDGFLDFLYKGSEIDSVGDRTKVYVAEYDSQAHNFLRVWSTDYGSHGNVAGFGGFAVNDFDRDGKKEFAVAEMTVNPTGRVYIVENVSDNNFRLTWQDSIPIANPYYVGQGDIDGDGFPELFVGATPGDGNWTVVIEADSNDHYSPRLLMHLLSGGLFDNPQYMTTDVDGDGKLELVICAGSDIYMFKSNADNQYYLWHLKRENARDGIQFYDFNKDGRKDFIVSKNVWVDPPGYPRNYSDIYVGTSLVAVNEQHGTEISELALLYPNYPNPFNPVTIIRYSIPKDARLSLAVYDILGREVAILESGVKSAGSYTVNFDASRLASGVYVFRLQADEFSMTRKMLVIK
jgi:hypothetical protein